MINILLAEDDEGDIFLIKKTFKSAYFENELHIVHNGEEALDYLRNNDKPKIDFVITDLNMPKMSGHEFLDQVRQDERLRKIPIAVLTNSQDIEDYSQTYQLEGVICQTKPLDQRKINEIIKAIEEFWIKKTNI
ncbi:MAG: response regulator [Alcanivorax sp.]